MVENKIVKSSESSRPVNETLQNVKDNSWAGHLSDDTTEIEFLIGELKAMLSDDIEPKVRLEVIKQLSGLERDRIAVAKHLDMVMLKRSEISTNGGKSKNKEVVSLWQSE